MADWDLPTTFLEDATADPLTLGLILHGSRAVGAARKTSDYDLIRVVTDEEYARRKAANTLLERTTLEGFPYVDALYQSPARLRWQAESPGWTTATYVSARVVLDKTGKVGELVETIVKRAGQLAFDAVPEAYDSYLNSFVRSLKSWHRGDELGGRLHSAESAFSLIRTVFGLERRWPPYYDLLFAELAAIEEAQGWGRGALSRMLLRLVERGDPTFQQELEQRVETLLRDHGFEHDWGGDLEPLKALRF